MASGAKKASQPSGRRSFSELALPNSGESQAPAALNTVDAASTLHKSRKPVLYCINAVHNTWLKHIKAPAKDLSAKEKRECPKSVVYSVVSYTECPTDAHAIVELAELFGKWFIYEPHWRKVISGSQEIDWCNFGSMLTPSLSVGEVLQWDKRRIPGPRFAYRDRLLRTAHEFQKVRDAWGGPLGVTSFYRPEPVNQMVGGVPNSRHVTGEAFDIYPVGGSVDTFYRWICDRWTGGLGDGRQRGFIHLDCRQGGVFVPGAGVRPFTQWVY